MRSLASFLGIDFDLVLTTPTFNGYPVGANLSYEVRTTGVGTDPVDRYKEILDEEQREGWERVRGAPRGGPGARRCHVGSAAGAVRRAQVRSH